MGQKVYKTYRQLLSILRNRGLAIGKGSAGSRTISLLEKENYYNVINGYKKLFIAVPATATSEEIYKTYTTFDEIYALYLFDHELRHVYLKHLLRLENHFKTAVAHLFSKQYGHENYLKVENFHSAASTDVSTLKRIATQKHLDINIDLHEIQRISMGENIANTTRLIGDIQQEIARQLGKHNDMVSHYMTVHGYIPLWVLVNVLSFGKVTTFYLNMKEPEKILIAKQFGLHYRELHKYMTMLGFARNKCAHDERFYDIRFSQRLHTKSIPNFSILNLPRDKSGSYTQGICDAYAIAIIFKRLLSKQDFNSFCSSFDVIIRKLSKQLKVINVQDVLNIMGFTQDWRNITKLRQCNVVFASLYIHTETACGIGMDVIFCWRLQGYSNLIAPVLLTNRNTPLSVARITAIAINTVFSFIRPHPPFLRHLRRFFQPDHLRIPFRRCHHRRRPRRTHHRNPELAASV
jgi:abortive infection bacteriophage resistance protein